MQNLSQYRPYQQTWVLPQGRAQTFKPNAAGVLRVTAGRAWVTLGKGLAGDDVFLAANASLALQAGQVVVLEPWPLEPAAQLGLVWEVATEGTALPNPPYVPAQPTPIRHHLRRVFGPRWRGGYCG